MRGLGVPDVRWSFANIDTAGSTYTEAGPRPASPVPGATDARLVPAISGDQATSIDLRVGKSGVPAANPREAGGMLYRVDGDADTEWRGWNGWGVLQRYDTLSAYTIATVRDDFDIAPYAGRLKAYAVATNKGNSAIIRGYALDSTTWTWSTEANIITEDTIEDLTLAALPSDDLILVFLNYSSGDAMQWRAYRSADEGATWSLYDPDPFNENANPRVTMQAASMTGGPSDTQAVLRLLPDGTGIFLRRCIDGANEKVEQYASPAGLSAWQRIGTWDTNSAALHLDAVPLADGRVMVAYLTESGNNLAVRVIGSAYDPLEDSEETVISGSAYTWVTAWQDASGRVYIMATQGANLRVWYADDPTASTWAQMETESDMLGGSWCSTGDGSTTVDRMRSALVGGSLIVLHNSTQGAAGSDFDETLRAAVLGGWSTLEVPGVSATTNGEGITWAPWELPDTIAGFITGGAGTSTLVSPGELEIVTTSGQAKSSLWDGGTGVAQDVVIMCQARCDSGGNDFLTQVGVEVRTDDGTNSRDFALNLDTNSFGVEDLTDSAQITFESGNFDEDHVFCIYYNGSTGAVSIWFREPTDVKWTESVTDYVLATSASSGANQTVEWGHVTASASTSHWRFFWARTGNGSPPGALQPGHDTDTWRGLPMAGGSTPIPEASGTRAARLLALGGPGRFGDEWDADVLHDYPVESVFHEVSPSPARKWRTTGTAEATIEWDNTYDTSLGNGSVYIYVDGANFRTIVLEGWNGSSWVSEGTMDLAQGFTSVAFQRDGDVVHPNTSGADGLRHMHHSEFVGGTVDMGTDIRKIRRQTEGFWNAATQDRKWPEVWLDGVDGTEPSSGTASIWSPRGVRIIHNVPRYDKWRVRIPSQSTADGYFEAGVISIGGVHPFGQQPSRGLVSGQSPNTTTERDDYGTTRVRESGPPQRRVQVQWADPMDQADIARLDADYFAANSGDPLVSRRDVPKWLEGIQRDVSSGQTPCLYLHNIPDVDITLTDRTLFVWGRIVQIGDRTHVLGNEGVDDVWRVGSLLIEELV